MILLKINSTKIGNYYYRSKNWTFFVTVNRI